MSGTLVMCGWYSLPGMWTQDSQSTAVNSQRWNSSMNASMNASIFRMVGGVGHSSIQPGHEKRSSDINLLSPYLS